MAQSSIEWTQLTWNPTTGCNKISAGCKFCYAEVMSKRLKAMGHEKYRNGFKLKLHPDMLHLPYTWNVRKIVFVNSMSDLFHEEIPLNFLKQVFHVMNENPQHTFQILTKRSEYLKHVSSFLDWTENIWMGVSVENEKVKYRITDLAHTPALIKFLSIEPLIGDTGNLELNSIDWVIAGGESGHHARPIKKEWAINIQKQCARQGIAFFFKQWGKPQFNPDPDDPTISSEHPFHAKGGCQLNGKIYRQMPQVNNVKLIES